MIPNELNITLEFRGREESGIEDERSKRTGDTKQLLEYATVLEGLSRNAGVHAAGVVIGDRDLSEYVPLCRDQRQGVISQYPMGPLNDLGLLKMDFLGLKTLTVIEDTVTLIRKRVPDFSLRNIPFDDAGDFRALQPRRNHRLFQMESGGMTSVCQAIRCPEDRRHHRVDRALSARDRWI